MSDNENENEAVDDQAMADEWAEALAAQTSDGIDNAALDAQPADLQDFSEFDDDAPITQADKKRLEGILDIPVTISMEVGRSKINIRNLLQLNQGSVVELDRVAGEPLDVLVNGTLIAHGEVVVVNDKFGIRLTDVISQTERIKKLR
ncbi:flagellar motor switch protein FliN [Echinimonas agarilytica]|uniref:Flagellar motor switch protein FliN n=1 Tax=Echinimonas agarilytica TaxID=1215918 RepID=A0AA41W4Y2_9GAMM|nr:flagellar motor switch protein FliN [Echinimonas agarilytica]MCM2678975.1 flagellar motor switch protein FliN [Echinimonas agarilytica]